MDEVQSYGYDLRRNERLQSKIDLNDVGIDLTNLINQVYLKVKEGNQCSSIETIEKVSKLEQRIEQLERFALDLKGAVRVPDEVDEVYNLFKEELEKRYIGKIIAIDVPSKSIVGIGSTASEAYDEARKKTGKEQFDFRRVGFKYLRTV